MILLLCLSLKEEKKIVIKHYICGGLTRQQLSTTLPLFSAHLPVRWGRDHKAKQLHPRQNQANFILKYKITLLVKKKKKDTAEMGCTGRKGNRSSSTSINSEAIAMSVGLDLATD